MSLTLSSAVDRALISAAERSERYLMFSIAASPGKVSRPPLNLAIVVDRSGSMGGSKLSRAKKAANFVVQQLNERDRLAVVIYDDNVEVIVPSALMTPAAKIAAMERISAIEAGGSTNLSGGWLAGCKEVARNQAGDKQVDRVLLLTDGLANIGITRVDELIDHAEQLRKLGVTTSTLGIGVDFDEELLTAMARHGGGRFQFIENSKAIPDCIAGELGELMSFAARRAAIDLVLPPGVRVESSLNDDLLERDGNRATVTIGDIQSGTARSAVLALVIESGAALDGSLTVSATLRYVDSETGASRRENFADTIFTPASNQAVVEQPVNQEVNDTAVRLRASTIREQAARKARDGDRAGAAHIMAAGSSALSAMPPSPMLAQELQEIDALQSETASGMTAGRIKEVQYQTYLRKSSRQRYDDQK